MVAPDEITLAVTSMVVELEKEPDRIPVKVPMDKAVPPAERVHCTVPPGGCVSAPMGYRKETLEYRVNELGAMISTAGF